jgi:hypothetical protein
MVPLFLYISKIKMKDASTLSRSEIYSVSIGYPAVGTVSYPVPTRTRSDKMYPVHHSPGTSCTTIAVDVPSTTEHDGYPVVSPSPLSLLLKLDDPHLLLAVDHPIAYSPAQTSAIIGSPGGFPFIYSTPYSILPSYRASFSPLMYNLPT